MPPNRSLLDFLYPLSQPRNHSLYNAELKRTDYRNAMFLLKFFRENERARGGARMLQKTYAGMAEWLRRVI